MPKLPLPAGRKGSSLAWREITALFSILTDLSFKRLVTPLVVRTLYSLSLIGSGLAAIGWICRGFWQSTLWGLFYLVTAPLAFFIYVLTARVLLEFMLAVFRIAENTEKLRAKSEDREA